MYLSLFTVGVMLTAFSVSWALRALEYSKMAIAMAGPTVRFGSETRPMLAEVFGLARGGVFEYNHAIVERDYSPHPAYPRVAWRVRAFPWNNNSNTGYIVFPPYRR